MVTALAGITCACSSTSTSIGEGCAGPGPRQRRCLTAGSGCRGQHALAGAATAPLLLAGCPSRVAGSGCRHAEAPVLGPTWAPLTTA
jgi:hypothetical protein